jgi:hypothetical protein
MANSVIDEILRQGARQPRKYVLAALATGRVESNFRNLAGGDRDSVGWRQERASLYRNPRNLKASVRRFYQEAAAHDHGQNAGRLTADVQRPAAQFRGRYGQVMGEAKTIYRRGGGRSGGGGGSGVQHQAQLSSTSTPNVAELLSTLTGGRQARPQTAAPPVLSLSAQANVPSAALPEGLEQAFTPPPAPAQSPDQPDYGQILSQLTDLIGGTVAQREAAQAPGESQIGMKGERGHNPSKLYELFWNGPGATNVKNGERVGKGFVSGHTDHVHVASNQKALLSLGRLAQGMGLHVGENPAFGGVDPVHVQDSYHYGRTKGREHDRAIDVSGDPAAMRKFAKKVAQIYRL